MTDPSTRERTLRALLNAANIRRARLVERLQFETREVIELTRALIATTRARTTRTDHELTHPNDTVFQGQSQKAG